MRCNPAFPLIPDGYDEVLQVFGNIHNYIRNDGTLNPAWESEQLAMLNLPAPLHLSFALQTSVTRMRCHRLVVPVFALALGEIHSKGLWSHLENFGGCFEFRAIRGRAGKLSLHAFGIALDFDVQDNPIGKENVGKMHPGIVAVFDKYGMSWGGKFQGRKDTMHYQYGVNA